jgi:hypothetical protein
MAKDLFSKQSDLYARYRPTYPKELYDYILSFVKEKNTVWDCATGNGQAQLFWLIILKKLLQQISALHKLIKQQLERILNTKFAPPNQPHLKKTLSISLP